MVLTDQLVESPMSGERKGQTGKTPCGRLPIRVVGSLGVV